MVKSDELVVRVPDLSQKINGLAKRLGEDKDLLRSFGERPANVLLDELLVGQDVDLSTAHLSASNRFLQGALANKAFREWAAEYQKQLASNALTAGGIDSRALDRKKILEDISGALLATGDRTLVADWSDHLSSASPRAWDSVVVTDDIAVVTKGVALLLVVVTAIDATPYAPPDNDLPFVAPADIRALSDSLVSSAQNARR